MICWQCATDILFSLFIAKNQNDNLKISIEEMTSSLKGLVGNWGKVTSYPYEKECQSKIIHYIVKFICLILKVPWIGHRDDI